MRGWKLTASVAVAAATIVVGPAQARRGQIVAADVVSEQPGLCTVVTVEPPYIYPAPNWEPFFRRHLYRYALVPTCVPIIGSVAPSRSVISVRY
jgi:hypothetical protein